MGSENFMFKTFETFNKFLNFQKADVFENFNESLTPLNIYCKYV